MKIFKTLTSYNYLVPIYLFIHYLLRSGSKVELIFKEESKYEYSKYNPIYLSLGHFKFENHHDLYDFNVGEWPKWLIDMGKPFDVTW